MNLRHAVALLAFAPIAACATGDGAERARTNAEQAEAAAPQPDEDRGFFGRLFGREARVPNAGPCPLMGVLYDSSRIVEFKGPEAFANVGYTGEVRGVRGLCRYIGGDPIDMNLEIDFALGRGPAAEGDTHTYKYWVAVTRKDVAPIARQTFERTVTFPRGADRVTVTENIERILIPRANDTVSGANFEVLVGFELTPEQLAFNRDGKRFRVDVGG